MNDEESRFTSQTNKYKEKDQGSFNSLLEELRAKYLHKEFFESRLLLLNKEIEKIDRELEARGSIHKRIIEDIEYELKLAKFYLEWVHWALGNSVRGDMERNFFRRRIADLRKQRRDEELKLWKEVLSLKEKRRELEKEIDEVTRRYSLLR